jgi:adenylate cyclase
LIYLGAPLLGWGLLGWREFLAGGPRAAYAGAVALFGLLAGLQAYRSLAGLQDAPGQKAKTVRRQTYLGQALVALLFAALVFIPFSSRRAIGVFPELLLVGWTGAALCLPGYLLIFWSGLALGKQYSAEVTIQKDHQLITGGPYRLVRHPRYLGILALALGLSLLFHSWIGLVVCLVVLGLVLARIHDEEALLQQEFGAAWKQYCQHTAPLIPFLPPQLFPKSRPLRWALPAVALLLVVLVQGLAPRWAERIEGWTLEARFRLRGAEPPGHPIVVVALDEESSALLNERRGENIRTWPRARWAELVDRLAAGQPRLIALDAVFDTPGWDAGGDEALAQAIARARANGAAVVLASSLETLAGAGSARTVFNPPTPVLEQAASAAGVTSVALDADGVLRRTVALWLTPRQTLPSFSLASAALYQGRAPIKIEDLDPSLSLLINYRGPERTFPTIPVYQVLLDEEGFDPQTLNGAIVLVGYTTLLEQDRHLAPFGGRNKLPGVEINANIIDMLLAGDWLRRPPAWLPLALAVAAWLVGWVCASLRSPGIGAAALGGAAAAYAGLGAWLFARDDWVLPLAGPLLIAVLTGAVSITERIIFTERDKRLLRQRFAGLMSPERLQALLDNWENLLNTDRPEKTAAVLFADIRGFTHATEVLMKQQRSPEMVRFLNAYLDAMAQAIFKEGGVIYRTFGDGLLVLFGLPEPLADHPHRAVRAAVQMAVASQALQDLWPLRNEGPFEMGIGLNDGPMVDAIVGRGRRFDYTVLGDAVNAAARIESHCKLAMQVPRPPGDWQVPPTATLLISAELYAQVPDCVQADDSIPPFEARGKAEALRVVRVLGLKEVSV